MPFTSLGAGSIPADTVKVTVKDGWVTLEGTVHWEYQKSLAQSAMKKLRARMCFP
jgi:osmotically-inducible protein OsmY